MSNKKEKEKKSGTLSLLLGTAPLASSGFCWLFDVSSIEGCVRPGQIADKRACKSLVLSRDDVTLRRVRLDMHDDGGGALVDH